MTKQMTATQTKARMLKLLDDVERGEVIEITRHGRTVARLVPARGAHALRGRMAGMAMSAATDEDLFTTGARWELD
jgi:prevent-host-death family protein